MFSDKFSIKIASLPYRENLVAEIYYNHEQWVEISQETNDLLIVQFYSPLEGKYWEFDLEEALEVLQTAKKKLVALEVKRE
ncbi:MAG: hypothetical protein WCP39_00620 [Chlamydiota bacterium]